ncbi:MAG: hypothetical protein RBS38_07675 [Bacteroidales bacterium]|nr:hypothetical protein [Bacteroidales bacterium]
MEKLLKIFISSFLKSLIVNEKYRVPEKAVRIRKDENKTGVPAPGDTRSIFSLCEISGFNEENKIYRLNKINGTRCNRSFHMSPISSETRVLIYWYKNGPCSINREIRLIDNN